MTLLRSNILPSDRTANLPLQKYQLVCVVPTWVSMHMVQLISDTIYFAGIAPIKTPSGPQEVQQGLGVVSSNYGPPSVLRSACRPQQGHQAPYQSSFHQGVLRPQAGVGRNTTSALGWPVAGNRHTATTSRVHLSSSTKRLERCLRPMADQ